MMLPEITYKPGWKFSYEDHEAGRFVRVDVGPPASDKGVCAHTGEPRNVTFMFLLPEPFDPAWLLNRIQGIEHHETCEWFRTDGVLVDDPHGLADGD